MELGGQYLPVLAIDNQVHDSWRVILPFKQHLEISDLLTILHEIAISTDEDKDLKKERISKIYREIIERDMQGSQEVIEWGRTHKILSQSGEFLPANMLTYITVEGFNNGGNKVYCEKVGKEYRDKLLVLLKSFGVKVITHNDINTTFNYPIENDELKTQLISKLQYIAVLLNKSNLDFEARKAELDRKISETHFYKCDSILLTYGEDNDTISKATFTIDNNFYYTGNISPTLVEPLLSPLSNHFNLGSGNESKLMVILLTSDHQSLVDYLKDCGFDVSMLIVPLISSINYAEIGGVISNDPMTQQQIIENNEAKALVLEHLEHQGFNISNITEEYSLIQGVTKDGTDYPLVVKSAKNYHHSMHLNPSEWRQLFRPNSMLWVHLGNRVVVPIKAFDLLTYQDRVTLSFGSVNMLEDDRVHKIMQVMRYFNDVHLNIASMDPNTNRGETLDDILFNNNNLANSDLGEDTGIEF